MKQIVLLSLFLLPFLSYAQKTKIDINEETNEVSVDGTASFKLEKVDCGFAGTNCHFIAYDLAGTKVFSINLRSYNSPTEITSSNPKGTVHYYEYIFFESKQKAEIQYVGIKTEKVAKNIVTNKLFSDGKLDPKSVDEFVLSNGTPFADKVKF